MHSTTCAPSVVTPIEMFTRNAIAARKRECARAFKTCTNCLQARTCVKDVFLVCQLHLRPQFFVHRKDMYISLAQADCKVISQDSLTPAKKNVADSQDQSALFLLN